MPLKPVDRRRYSRFSEKSAPDIALRSLFYKYDVNGDSRLELSELTSLLINDMGLNVDEAEAYMYLLDRNGDAHVSFEEYQQWITSDENLANVKDESRYTCLRRAISLFQRYDSDGNFCLDRQELRQLLIESGGQEEHLEVALNQLDIDGNGVVSFTEFLNWLNWAPLKDLLF